MLESLGYKVDDLGVHDTNRVNYPEYATALVKKVLIEKAPGILLCGSGIGMSMVANRYQGIRAALCRTVEEAKLSRQHNNANVLCLGARTTELTTLQKIVQVWLNTEFEGGRHAERVALFDAKGETF